MKVTVVTFLFFVLVTSSGDGGTCCDTKIVSGNSKLDGTYKLSSDKPKLAARCIDSCVYEKLLPDGASTKEKNERFCFHPNGIDETKCKVDGKWKDWTEWGMCSEDCGTEGRRVRSRVCTPPENGGEKCSGDVNQNEACNVKECPVDGKWKDWTEWGMCSKVCGGGQRVRSRECTPPEFGGEKCIGEVNHYEACNEIECPVDGKWQDWTAWGMCSEDCGGGQHERRRVCTPPENGGEQCSGGEYQNEACNVNDCPACLQKKKYFGTANEEKSNQSEEQCKKWCIDSGKDVCKYFVFVYFKCSLYTEITMWEDIDSPKTAPITDDPLAVSGVRGCKGE